LSDTEVYEPKIRALLGTASHFSNPTPKRRYEVQYVKARLAGTGDKEDVEALCLEVEKLCSEVSTSSSSLLSSLELSDTQVYEP